MNNAAWAACDTFRGVIDAANYKDYILVMWGNTLTRLIFVDDDLIGYLCACRFSHHPLLEIHLADISPSVLAAFELDDDVDDVFHVFLDLFARDAKPCLHNHQD